MSPEFPQQREAFEKPAQRQRVIHRRAFVMPAVFQHLFIQFTPQYFFTLRQPLPTLRVIGKKQAADHQRLRVFEQVICQQVLFRVLAQKIQLLVNARAPLAQKNTILRQPVFEQRVCVNPVHDAQRSRIGTPPVTAPDDRLPDPAFNQFLAPLPPAHITAIPARPRRRDEIPEVMKLIIPQMTFIAPVPVRLRNAERAIEQSEFIFQQPGQHLVIAFQRSLVMKKGRFKELTNRFRHLRCRFRRAIFNRLPARSERRQNCISTELRNPDNPIKDLLPAQVWQCAEDQLEIQRPAFRSSARRQRLRSQAIRLCKKIRDIAAEKSRTNHGISEVAPFL